jgi:Ca2+-binding EF-hand superfamily protein
MIGDGKWPIATALLLLAVIGLTAADVAPPKSAPAPAVAPTNQPPQLLFLGEKRPLRFRLDVRVRGKPFQQAWEDFLGRLFDYADVNGDKVLTPDEAQRLPQARVLLSLVQRQFGFFDDKSIAPFAELDGNKDGKVSLDELKTYYRKNGFGPWQVQPDQEQGAAQVLTDALFKHLDLDKDGKLSRQEIAQAEKTLAALDINDDELVTPEELVPGLEFGFGRAPRRPGPGDNAPVLSLINPDDPAAKQAAPLLARYDKDKNGKLSRAEVGFDEATFNALDANKDGQLDATELAGWFNQPPDLELMAPLSGPRRKSPRPAGPLAWLFGAADEWSFQVVPSGGRAPALAASLKKREDGTMLLTTEAALVEFRRERGSEEGLDIFRRFLREQFRAALRGNKTYVDKKDAARNPRLKGLFSFIDRDGDGKATEEELNAFLDLLERGTTSYTVVAIGDRGPCLFELLDTNRDRQLSLRELRAAWQSVAPWDTNKDGALARDEVPRHLRVTLCAGMPVRRRFFDIDEESANASALTSKPGPLWFRRMDVNGDGDVSRREWLGSEEDFRRIDADGDGLISLEEAVKADGWFRKKADPSQ